MAIEEGLTAEEEIALRDAAEDSIGMYPKAVNGKERTDWQDGWNKAIIEITRKESDYINWYKNLSPVYRVLIRPLIVNGVVFLFEGKERDIRPHYNVSDLFAWGYSDFAEIEDINHLREIYYAWLDEGGLGILKRECKVHNQKPQKPVQDMMEEEGVWDEEMDSLPDNEYDKAVEPWINKVLRFLKIRK